MKRFLLLAGVLSLFTFQSCKQCTECVRYAGGIDNQKLCKKDYASDDSYTAAFHYLEANGYDCK